MDLNLGNLGTVSIAVTLDPTSLFYLFIMLVFVGIAWALSAKYIAK